MCLCSGSVCHPALGPLVSPCPHPTHTLTVAPAGKAAPSSRVSPWADLRVTKEPLGNGTGAPAGVQVRKCGVKAARRVPRGVRHHMGKAPLCPLRRSPTSTDILCSDWARPFHSSYPPGQLLLVTSRDMASPRKPSWLPSWIGLDWLLLLCASTALGQPVSWQESPRTVIVCSFLSLLC